MIHNSILCNIVFCLLFHCFMCTFSEQNKVVANIYDFCSRVVSVGFLALLFFFIYRAKVY